MHATSADEHTGTIANGSSATLSLEVGENADTIAVLVDDNNGATPDNYDIEVTIDPDMTSETGILIDDTDGINDTKRTYDGIPGSVTITITNNTGSDGTYRVFAVALTDSH